MERVAFWTMHHLEGQKIVTSDETLEQLQTVRSKLMVSETHCVLLCLT
jgi:hypothetical protein